MSWRPSIDQSIRPAAEGMSFWEAVQTYYDLAAPISPLPRNDWDALRSNYILDRAGKPPSDAEECKTMRAQLPPELRHIPLGHTELDVLGLLINYELDRALTLEGPRGAGKSTLLHYIEAAVRYSGYERYPIFLVLDGNSLDEEKGADDYASLLVDEIVAQSRALPGHLRSIFNSVCTSIQATPTVTGIREALRLLAERMGPLDKRRIVVVFDNLDHLTIRNVQGALDLARRIYVHTGLACIACVRQRCLEGIYRRGDARKFFNLHVTVTAPKVDVWIRSLGRRIHRVAQKHVNEKRQSIYAYAEPIEPDRLATAMNLFVDVLMQRPKQKDDIQSILQAASADDTRHLGQLVRRMLAHHSLPGRFLLGLADPSDYYPLRGLLEGYEFVFHGDHYIPNLLSFDSGEGSADFLICHRVLRLLGNGLQWPTEKLIHWMDIFGYDRDTTVRCLQMLHVAILIRGTDSEVLKASMLPESLYLTEAGALYRDHLISNAEYLLSAVLDVPLEHAALRGATEAPTWFDSKDIRFSARLDSLQEYTREVIGRELAQLRTLTTKPSPGLRRVADVLQRDGLFASSLYKALSSLTGQSGHTKALKALDATYLPSLKEKIERAYTLVDELVNRARRRTRQRHASSPVQLPGIPIIVEVSPGGDDLEITASLYSGPPQENLWVNFGSGRAPSV